MKFDVFDDWNPAKRKPDNDRVDLPWNSKFKPKLFGHPHKWGEEKPYIHDWFKIIGDYGQFNSFDWFAEECKRLVILDSEIPKRQQEYIDKVKAQAS